MNHAAVDDDVEGQRGGVISDEEETDHRRQPEIIGMPQLPPEDSEQEEQPPGRVGEGDYVPQPIHNNVDPSLQQQQQQSPTYNHPYPPFDSFSFHNSQGPPPNMAPYGYAPPHHSAPPFYGSAPTIFDPQAFAAGVAFAAQLYASSGGPGAAFHPFGPRQPPMAFGTSHQYPSHEQHQYHQQWNSFENLGASSQASGQARSRPSESENDFQDPLDESDHYNEPQHRRKRQQRLPPPPEDASQHSTLTFDSAAYQPRPEPREKIRRRLRQSDGDSSSSGSSFYHHYHSNSSSNNNYSHRRHYKKKKARSDESLLGKTAVSALYEWCSKRQRTPIFEQQDSASKVEFDFTVALNDEEDEPLGRGRGATKSAAKQHAARRALERLLPEVVFDDSTGILVQLPSASARRRAAYERSDADDLAPNLAKRLAIGRSSHLPVDETAGARNSHASDRAASSKRSSSAAVAKRSLDVYPGTSTTSEDEDENKYYSSHGAGILSNLLKQLIQVDPRIPEFPRYKISPMNSGTSMQSSSSGYSRRKHAAMGRGPFSATACLKICFENNDHSSKGTFGDLPDGDGDSSEKEIPSDRNETLLEANGMGATKREACHRLDTKLLALLFPECTNLVEVKAAAEALVESLVGSKAAKQQLHSSNIHRPRKRQEKDTDQESSNAFIPNPTDLFLPPSIQRALTDLSGVSHRKEGVKKDQSEAFSRQVSRQKQIDVQVDAALNTFNEKDEEGRVRPSGRELTADDVGRTILRRAGDEDCERVEKLLLCTGANNRALPRVAHTENHDSLSEVPHGALALGTTPAIVLLLCRAIAHDDPPLGTAVLSFGFSIDDGRLLRVARILNEPHLPLERFREILEEFAALMKCKLVMDEDSSKSDGDDDIILKDDLSLLLESQVSLGRNRTFARPAELQESRLSSVKEESEVSDTSTVEKRDGRRVSKPSKRTRVE